MSLKYLNYNIRIIIIIIIVIGTLNNTFKQIGFDGLNKIDTFIKDHTKFCFSFDKKFYILTGVCLILLISNKYFWLPFLGETVLPSSLIPERIITGDTNVNLVVRPNSKVAYWAGLPTEKIVNVYKAYDKYQNAGVVTSDKDGKVTLTFNKGLGYTLPNGVYMRPHVHYRVISNNSGFVGPVKTHYL